MAMRVPAGFLLTLLPLVVLAACDRGEAGNEKSSADRRLILSQGYSMLYKDVSRVEFTKLILYVKVESEAVNEIVTAISDYSGALEKDLERIARDYPGVRIDLKPLPEMEVRKRFAIGRDRALRFAPLAGRSRLEYERTMLISLSNAFNHESHLCQVMAREEPDPGLKQFLLDTEKRYIGFYERVMDLLNREHFRSTGNPEKPGSSR